MDTTYEYDVSLSVDMDDLGVRSSNWLDFNKNLDHTLNDFFGKEKAVELAVYTAEFGNKLTTNEEETSMSDDDNDGTMDYDIDPETGEKIFRQVTFTSNISISSPNDKWIEEYLSNIESSSNQILPVTTNNSEFNFENLSFTSVDNSNEQIDSNWFSNLIHLDENSDNILFTDPMIPNEFLDDNDYKSNQLTTTNNESTINDESSTSSQSSSSHRHQSSSSQENDGEIIFLKAKLEKIEHEGDTMSHMFVRRTSTRSSNQGQLDEDTLRQFNIPLTLNDITQSSTEEYNGHLIRLSHLTAEQMQIIKDIRRRGKNKIAAQNCRKRKAISVESLLEEVDELKRVKHELEERKRAYQQQIAETRHQFEYLHQQVLPDRQLPPAIIVK